MRVLINGQAALGARTGIGHYTAELIRCLQASLVSPDEVVSYQPDWLAEAKRNLSWLRDRIDKPTSAGPSAADRSYRLNWRQWVLAQVKQAGLWFTASRLRAISRQGFDLYHEPNFIPLSCDLPTVVSVHDLSVLHHPEWHPAHRVHDWERRFRAGLKQCVHVVTISEFGRQQVIRTLGLSPHLVTRTYMGYRPHFRPMPAEVVQSRIAALGLPPTYLLHVGTIEPRKNLLMLMRAFCDLPAPVREACPLVLVGGWGWNSADVHDYLSTTGKDRQVRHMGYVAESDLSAVYNGARALVFPTHYEGFGIPSIEMMACGGAVLASTAGAVAEVVGTQGVLINPKDVEGWRDAMYRVITDNDWHASLCDGAIEKAAPFTWENCAADTIVAYRTALSQGRRLAA